MESTQTDITSRLVTDCQLFIDVAEHLSEDQFKRQINGKWSVAEVMQHLYLSARPVAKLMAGPRDVLKQWGFAEMPSRSYETIAAIYQKALGLRRLAPATMTPRPEDMAVEKHVIVNRFQTIYQALVESINGWSDDELDSFLIPHPLLGYLTVREMLYFTSAHTQHHLVLLPDEESTYLTNG
ncbi:DinB family protein [Spirosoma agri]|uniref:DinB family protein n=1 Tax=Spirosoma agri TaxID=1987381 RepID=A0A6M0IET2_9BACT|nr:DinB family protein [Spirosoma agri]NEU66704.1 DinB family protein [Spirosoma agri]